MSQLIYADDNPNTSKGRDYNIGIYRPIGIV